MKKGFRAACSLDMYFCKSKNDWEDKDIDNENKLTWRGTQKEGAARRMVGAKSRFNQN